MKTQSASQVCMYTRRLSAIGQKVTGGEGANEESVK